MKIETHSHAEHELAQLANRFDHWRQRRTTPRARIPQPLWAQAVSLSAVLPISRVAKRLRLSVSALKKHDTTKPVVSSSQGGPVALGFVEVTATAVWGIAAAEVELQRTDGARMRIAYRESPPPLAPLVRAFLEEL